MASMTDGASATCPVVDDERRAGGIISIGDVVKARLGQLETENPRSPTTSPRAAEGR